MKALQFAGMTACFVVVFSYGLPFVAAVLLALFR